MTAIIDLMRMEIILNMKTVTDYIEQLIPSKRKFYTACHTLKSVNYNEFDGYVAFLKNNELLYGPPSSVKGRIVWDPPKYIKVYLGAFNYNIIKILEKNPTLDGNL